MLPAPLPWLDDNSPLPPTCQAQGPHSDTPGLLALGGQVNPARLEQAYRQGVFPWYGPGLPVMWWTPDPRMVLPVAEFRISTTLRKTLRRFARSPGCEIRIDSAFSEVMQACANAPRNGQDGTWIVPEMLQAYREWHAQGRVHSVETWIDGKLVGGLYGVAIGRMFFGESMFARRSDASKMALAALVALCRAHAMPLIDCQQNTQHLSSLGGRELSRTAFERHLSEVLPQQGPVEWTYDSRWWALLGL